MRCCNKVILVKVLAAFIVIGSPALSQERVVRSILGLPEPDRRPAQSAFVLPGTHPKVSSETGPTGRASSNFFGLPGLIEMPSTTVLPDGELQGTISSFAGITRYSVTFQITPRLTGAFRYLRLGNINFSGFEDYYDRAFDLHYQMLEETDYLPAVAIGLRDFVGTGIEAGEYVVASKTFLVPGQAGQVRISGGLGWGRLGSYNDIGAPFGEDRPEFTAGDTGGEIDSGQWFRGPAAPFAGLEWQPGGNMERFRFKLEYSSDNYDLIAGDLDQFDRKSPLNFGVEYEARDNVRLGLYSLYGSEVGALVTIANNPRRTEVPLRLAGPGPVTRRPDRAEAPELWSSRWRASSRAPGAILDRLVPLLEEQGLILTGLSLPGTPEAANIAVVRVENEGFYTTAIAVGRIARAMAASFPASVETFQIILEDAGLPISQVTVRRSDLERLDGLPDRTPALAALTTVAQAPHSNEGVIQPEGFYPRSSLSLRPAVATSFFDPDSPLRFDLNLLLNGRIEPTRGLALEATLVQKLAGTIGDSPLSDSALEPVRTLTPIYADQNQPTLRRFTLSYVNKLPGDLYGRITAGYLERMFGGVSTELLWKPVNSRLALGSELNYVGQRDFDQRFGFQDYRVFTGHLSAYYEFGEGYHGQLDLGRYLAGDTGATITFAREFANGWRVGAFATFTDVSADDFGEGSFDKGIIFTIPNQVLSGNPGTGAQTRVIRPVLRDGGARLDIPGRLYERVRRGHTEAVFADWSRVWR